MRLRRPRLPSSASMLLVAALLPACGETAPTPAVPVASAASPTGAGAASSTAPATAAAPMPELRTGALVPVDHQAPLAATVLARSTDDAFETLELRIPRPPELPRADRWSYRPRPIEVALDGDPPLPYAFVAAADTASSSRDGAAAPDAPYVVWIRRPRALAGKPLSGHLYTPADSEAPGHHLRFRAEADAMAKAPASSPAVEPRWALALAAHLDGIGESPFHRFAARRLRERYPQKQAAGARDRGLTAAPPPRGELVDLMDTLAGATSIQEALQSDRGLILAANRQKPTVPLGSVAGVGLAQHPWAEMLRRLGAAPPPEPLAAATPAEFYFIRARSLVAALDLLDRTDTLGTPAAGAIQRRGERRDLALRYEAELGLGRGPLTRALGPEVIEDLALIGSDPYANEGTDLTVLFRIKPGKKALFDAAIAVALAAHGAAHGGVTFSKRPLAGAEIAVGRSADGAIRQHRATSGDLEIVSNSPGALGRVLETLQKKRPALAAELDFQYMLARDAPRPGAPAPRDDVLVFLGDRFVAEVVGPRQKILEARRQLALAELQTPGFAALLHGLVTGGSPATSEALLKSGLLRKEELAHATGGAITWAPGQAARSAWGTAAALVPLIDLPAPTQVTEVEATGYRRFADSYRSYWSQYIDPIAIRLGTGAEGGALTADVRILPILDGSEYRRLHHEVGHARADAPPLRSSGARAIIAIGEDAGLRGLLGSLTSSIGARDRLKLDWLGTWAMVGVDDAPALARAALAEYDVPQLPSAGAERAAPEPSTLEAMSQVPLYGAVAVKSSAGAAVALLAARKLAEEAIPGMFTWGEHESRRGVSIVRVAVRDPDAPSRAINVFYALAKGALYLALHEDVIRRLVDEALDGRGPRGEDAAAPAAKQLIVEGASGPGAPLSTVLGWLLEAELVDQTQGARATAGALFRGASEVAAQPAGYDALALAYLGYVPVTPAGQRYVPAPEGARDPDRGTPYAPVWPALPVKGSPAEALLRLLSRFRTELAFDEEPAPKGAAAIQSLHARVSLGGGGLQDEAAMPRKAP